MLIAISGTWRMLDEHLGVLSSLLPTVDHKDLNVYHMRCLFPNQCLTEWALIIRNLFWIMALAQKKSPFYALVLFN